jgi:hypothetical protein
MGIGHVKRGLVNQVDTASRNYGDPAFGKTPAHWSEDYLLKVLGG